MVTAFVVGDSIRCADDKFGFLGYRSICETASCSVSSSAAVLIISSSPSYGNEGPRMMNLAGKLGSSLFSNIWHFFIIVYFLFGV